MSTMEAGGSGKKSKSKVKGNVNYDSSRFTKKVEEKLYNIVWDQNGAVIERELDLVTLENSGIEFLQNFMRRGWISLTMFKAESILTICQEFMTDIKYKPKSFKFREKRTLSLSFRILGCQTWPISHELLLEGEEWDGGVQCNKTRLKDRASLLWVIGMEKTIDLPCMMFMGLCATHTTLDTRGSVPFTGFLTELSKRNRVHIPIDLIKIKPERPIDRSSLSRFKGQKKKRRLKAIVPEEPSIGMAELKEKIMNLRTEMSTRMTSLEEESSRHMTML
ncbi:hypothetical protein Acr_12g0000750 [Actinidia rufa]|uniref:Uncharacterized protein n=1 Tax=Actinidia rufa TaxID=165716 RepID=A0A7J0FFR6_9ERIC|nr:hypothetical protein Acr_12g0000750 [Actinidia rufa]